MFGILKYRTYRHLIGAQILSLIGSGLTTVALGLLAFDLAGADAGLVLGTALAIKMIAYVGVAPIASAVASLLPRRAFLVSLDCIRAAMVLFLPFVTEIWQIYTLVFLFQAFSAAFTPTFQATIPDVLPEERDYTNALTLSRLAYDMEALISPMLAGALLTLVSFHFLFVGTALGFLASAFLVLTVSLPLVAGAGRPAETFLKRLTGGSVLFLRTPRLRGLLALSFAAASAGAMVIVNTVVLVKGQFGLSDAEVALAFAFYGLGSMGAAFLLPRVIDRWGPRLPMLFGGCGLALMLFLSPALAAYFHLLIGWFVLGGMASLVQTPSGILLKRSGTPDQRPSLFAAQFALSHACWLVTYPLAGWLGAQWGLDAAFVVMGAGAVLGVVVAMMFWPDEPVTATSGPREIV
ncbi:MAG: MFS transporter [Parvibaculum sp.]